MAVFLVGFAPFCVVDTVIEGHQVLRLVVICPNVGGRYVPYQKVFGKFFVSVSVSKVHIRDVDVSVVFWWQLARS